MKLEEFVKGIAGQFDDTDPAEITADCRFQELDEWSSLTAMSLIAFVRTACGKSLTGREIRSCHTVEELFRLVEAK